MMRPRNSESFRRGKPKYKVQPKVLIICEDTKSSKTYLEDASRSFRAFAQVKVWHCGNTDPLGIVNEAIASSKNFDRVYCVIDRDSHHEPNFNQALALGEANRDRITVLVSYPCFEFWLILHFEYTRASYASAGGVSGADRVLKKLKTIPEMSGYSKAGINGLFEKLLPKLGRARLNAIKTIREGLVDNNMNPSTSMHILIDHLEALGSPAKI